MDWDVRLAPVAADACSLRALAGASAADPVLGRELGRCASAEVSEVL